MEITKNEQGFLFTTLNQEQKDLMIDIEIGRFSVTEQQIKKIAKMFNLSALTIDELRAVRNSVVRFLSDKKSEERNSKDCDWILYDQYTNNISGITAVIDNFMFALNPQSL